MIWQDYQINKVGINDKNYPDILRSINKPPKQLFYRGVLKQSLFKKSLAVVGSRRITRYGREVVERFIPALVTEKVVIVSGFMYGVDTTAHSCVVQNGGVTVAVLGSGIDTCYPPENEKLYTKILLGKGAILSEYEPEVKPKLWMYPQRNRIVSGLSSLGTLVIEAAEKSGSLITARLAREQNRDVFAVPGPITSSVSQGTNNLIKLGHAKMVINPSDILNLKTEIKKNTLIKLTSEEKIIYDILEREALTIDEISAESGKDIIEISMTISLMGLRGLLAEAGGKYYLSS